MDAVAIIDAVRRGNGAAARVVGLPHDLHRAQGPGSPVRSGTALMRLPAHFAAQRATLPSHGHPLFEGVFDAAYTRPGDYLVGPFTYFVASQLPLSPVVCVRVTRTLSFARAAAPGGAGLGSYGGLVRTSAQTLLDRWPASVVAAGSGLDRAGLPADAPLGGWSVLLPRTETVLRTGDLMTDDLGRAGVVVAAELSEHGWKLFVKQAAS